MEMAASSVPKLTLSDGNSIPILGFGTYKTGHDSETKEVVKYALEVGYCHLDCALVYENEKAIGEAIHEAIEQGIVKRSDLFITAKCWNTYHDRERVLEGCQQSLRDLGLEYIDLYLIHWPMGIKATAKEYMPKGKEWFSDVDYLETWEGMEECKARGYTRSIGVSNFNSEQIERILSNAKILPVMNQVECNPYMNQKPLLEFCRARGIALTAYAPLGARGATLSVPNTPFLLEDPKIKEIAEQNGKTTAQVLLRYQVQRGVVVIPKSSTKSRIKQNFEIFDFELSEEDMNTLDGLDKGMRYVAFLQYVEHPFYPFHAEF